MVLHTQYQGFKPCGFRREDVFTFSLYKPMYVKHVPPAWGYFWPHGYNLNKFSRGLLGYATYQTSRLYAFWFQTRRLLKLSSRKSIFSLCDLDMHRTKTIRIILVEGHPRIIFVKLFQNWTRFLGGVVI